MAVMMLEQRHQGLASKEVTQTLHVGKCDLILAKFHYISLGDVLFTYRNSWGKRKRKTPTPLDFPKIAWQLRGKLRVGRRTKFVGSGSTPLGAGKLHV